MYIVRYKQQGTWQTSHSVVDPAGSIEVKAGESVPAKLQDLDPERILSIKATRAEYFIIMQCIKGIPYTNTGSEPSFTWYGDFAKMIHSWIVDQKVFPKV